MTKFCVSFSVLAALLLVPYVAHSQQNPEHGLDHDIFGNKRILFVCNSGIDNPVERILPAMDWDGFGERDTIIVTTALGRVEILNADGTRESLSSDSLTQIHQRAKCNRGTDFNLIGKDGSVKKSWSDVVWIEDIFMTIDAMPMRRHEMRRTKRRN